MKNKVLGLVICFILIMNLCGCGKTTSSKDNKTSNEVEILKELPLPEVTGGDRGKLGIDKNINELNIDEYLNRSDSVYRDMRMLEDPGNYEAIGGDRMLSGYIKGFEIVPLPYIVPVEGLPKEVGDTYKGTTLFSKNDEGKYVANYEESMSILEELFPKDKVIFLMCGGGGYAGQMKEVLISLGWNKDKIYNIGGYWYYEGKNNVQVKKVENGHTTYDFDNVPYHKIEFDNLKLIERPIEELKLDKTEINLKEGKTYDLNLTIKPINSTDKNIIWKSENTKIATVDKEGKVKAITEGETIITASDSIEKVKVKCKIKVSRDYLVLDNISNEAKKYDSYQFSSLIDEWDKKIHYWDGDEQKIYDKYLDENGDYNKLWEEEQKNLQKMEKQYLKNRISILDSLKENKKSFIILFPSVSCLVSNFSLIETAEKILKQNNIDYLYVHRKEDSTFYDSKLYDKKILTPSIVLYKKGNLYAYTDPNKDSFDNENDVKKWLKKYIKIK